MSRIQGITRLSLLALIGAVVFAQGPASAGTSAAAPKSPAVKTSAVKTEATKTALASKPAGAPKHMAAPKVDLNGASREDLMKLPGIGDALADKIIAARPFKSKSDLISKNVLTKKQYSAVASHVIAKQETATNASSK